MLQNAYFLGKIGADTAENEQRFAEILRGPAGRRRRGMRFRPPAEESREEALKKLGLDPRSYASVRAARK